LLKKVGPISETLGPQKAHGGAGVRGFWGGPYRAEERQRGRLGPFKRSKIKETRPRKNTVDLGGGGRYESIKIGVQKRILIKVWLTLLLGENPGHKGNGKNNLKGQKRPEG